MEQKTRHLEGKGEMDYDYVNDILFFKVKNREYDFSLEFQNMIVDIDEDRYIVGIQIFDASKFFRVDKIYLRQIPKWKFEAKIEENTIELRLFYEIMIRNQIREVNPIIVQENTQNLPQQTMVVPV